MDRRRAGSPVYSRQQSGGSSSTGSNSPVSSPAYHRSASGFGTFSSIKRTQNLAAKVANARLAQVMTSQSAGGADGDEDDDDDDLLAPGGAGFRYGSFGPLASSNGGSAVFRRSARSPSPALGRNIIEHIPIVRSTSAGRPSKSVSSTILVPPSRTSVRTPSPIPAIVPPIDRRWDKRFSVDVEHLNSRETGSLREVSALRDELDMLQEENENVLEKLLHAEERCEEAEARAKELEKQVAALGEGVSLEARLLNRKEAALRQREVALKSATQAKDGRDEEVAVLQHEVEAARDGVATTVEQLREAESEAKALRTMTQRMILTHEEMEEVVLKRCWLARYWGLALRHGIYPEIAVSKHEHWSSLAPLPLEVVISAGQKAKEVSRNHGGDDLVRRNKLLRDLSDITGEGNIESMLSVEKGLRELASLKIEDAVMLAMAHHRHPNPLRQSTSDLKSPGDPKFIEAFELNQEESEDVSFKQAWLTYFWRRAKTNGVEGEIADERLRFWIGRSGQSLTSHDAVDVERGLNEVRKLGIEQQLWEASRREIEQVSSSDQKLSADADLS